MSEAIKDLELYAWIGEDELGIGAVGIKRAIVPAGDIPMVATMQAKMDQPLVMEQMRLMVHMYGKTRYLVRFKFDGIIQTIEQGG